MAQVVGLLRGVAGEHLRVDVEADIVGADLARDVQFRIVAVKQNAQLRVGDGVREIEVAGGVSAVDSGIVIAQHELQGLDLDFVRTVVVGVLGVGHALVVFPGGAGVSAVGNKAGLQRPGAGVGAVRVGGFNRSLRNREEGRESAQAQEVRAGRNQLDFQGRVVQSGHTNEDLVVGLGFLRSRGVNGLRDGVLFAGFLSGSSGGGVILGVGFGLLGDGVLFDQAVVQVAIVGSGLRVGGTVPAVNEIIRGQRGAVAPGALDQVEGVGQAVVALFVAFSQARGQFTVLVVGHQANEGVDSQDSAVNGGVEVRVQAIRLRSKHDVQGAGVGVQGRTAGRSGGLGCRLGRGLRARSFGSGGGRTRSATAGEAENHGGGKRRCHEFFHFLSLLRNSIRKTFARGFALDVRFPPI